MTHDELLDIIDFDEGMANSNKSFNALRAVVEIINSYEQDNNVIANKEFDQGVRALCRIIRVAIEKELE